MNTNTEPSSPEPSISGPEPEISEKTISLYFCVIDFAGKPISGLTYHILVENTTYQGTTDNQGCAEEITGLKPNQQLEIFVQKDNGLLASKYVGVTAFTDMSICAVSPHIKIEIETEPHKGPPVPPEPKAKPPRIDAPAAPGAGQIKKDGKHADTAEQQKTRTPKGNPRTVLMEKVADWAKRHQIPTFGIWNWDDFRSSKKGSTKPHIEPKKDPKPQPKSTGYKVTSPDQKPPKEVTEVVKIMEEQACWQWKKMIKNGQNSTTISTGILSGTFKPITGKKINDFNSQCYASVKVGLLRANFVKGLDNSGVSACNAGRWLIRQGFKDVTRTLPDGRWAFPGDVIVYRNSDTEAAKRRKKYEKELEEYRKAKEANEKNKTGKKPKPPSPVALHGHIDVRTYDGYISDAKTERLPDSTRYVVIGIYRKICDPLPDLRVRAFLKVIREWECHEEQDDAKRYFLLYKAINGKRRFTETSKHPYEGQPPQKYTPAGAYQITLSTYKDYSASNYGIGRGFSPSHQDRMAVALMQDRGENALALIRRGEIKAAVNKLKGTWSSLPGGRQQRKGKDMNDLLARFNIFLSEQIGE